jgi:group I intron endonuclease
MKQLPGIYAIIHTASQRLYIGSATHYRKRWHHHQRHLRIGDHTNSFLQHAWNKYGEQAFEFRLIEPIDDVARLIEREQYWMDYYKSYERDKGFNICKQAGSQLGRKASEATKNLWRKQRKGKRHSKETRERMSAAMKGNKNARNTKGARRFTDEEIAVFLQRHAAGEKLKDLALEYNVHRISLSRIKNGRTKQSRELHESGLLR